MKLINLTPHAITVVVGEKSLTIPPEPTPARCNTWLEEADRIDVDGMLVTVYKYTFGEVTGLPPKQKGVRYIVSRIVAEKSGRDDLLVPEFSIRDKEGRIIGCKGFSFVWKGENDG